jgi:hypothetical protein
MILTAEQKQQLWTYVISAWGQATGGDLPGARQALAEIDRHIPGVLNAELSLLRHSRGDADGRVVAIPPTETDVLSFQLRDTVNENHDAYGLIKPRITPEVIETSIARTINEFQPGYHRDNIRKDLPHVMVLSTGRCGTVSLFRLFEQSRLLAYHTYWYHVSRAARFDMLCRMLTGELGDQWAMQEWCQTRAAEWLGAVNVGRPMVGLNHGDTIFAPVFAAVHPQSKFVYLRRNPEEVFVSFFDKDQWGTGNIQLQPLLCAFDPDFSYRRCGYDVPTNLAWYLYFTDAFCRCFGRVLNDRFIEIDANKLFAQDRGEIERLITFTSSELDLDDAVEHFAVKINQKADRGHHTEHEIAAAFDVYNTALAKIKETGRL